MSITAARVTTRHNGLLDVTVTVDGEEIILGQEIHDPEDAAKVARSWDLMYGAELAPRTPKEKP